MEATACRASADKQHRLREGSECTRGVTVSVYRRCSSRAERLNGRGERKIHVQYTLKHSALR